MVRRRDLRRSQILGCDKNKNKIKNKNNSYNNSKVLGKGQGEVLGKGQGEGMLVHGTHVVLKVMPEMSVWYAAAVACPCSTRVPVTACQRVDIPESTPM
jgi:hypothetical protein